MLIGVEAVMELCHAPRSTAYVIIKELNRELQKKGFLVRPGRVEKKYLLERYNIHEEVQDTTCQQ